MPPLTKKHSKGFTLRPLFTWELNLICCQRNILSKNVSNWKNVPQHLGHSFTLPLSLFCCQGKIRLYSRSDLLKSIFLEFMMKTSQKTYVRNKSLNSYNVHYLNSDHNNTIVAIKELKTSFFNSIVSSTWTFSIWSFI